MPGEPTWRAMSAETMNTPEPIMDPATSAVASTRVSARTNSTMTAPQNRGAQFAHAIASQLAQRPVDFRGQDLKGAPDARLTARRQPVQWSATQYYRIRPERHGLDHVRTAPDTAIQDEGQPLTDGLRDFGEDI